MVAWFIPLLASAAASMASGMGKEGEQQAPIMGGGGAQQQAPNMMIPTTNPLESGMQSAQRRTKDKQGRFGNGGTGGMMT